MIIGRSTSPSLVNLIIRLLFGFHRLFNEEKYADGSVLLQGKAELMWTFLPSSKMTASLVSRSTLHLETSGSLTHNFTIFSYSTSSVCTNPKRSCSNEILSIYSNWGHELRVTSSLNLWLSRTCQEPISFSESKRAQTHRKRKAS